MISKWFHLKQKAIDLRKDGLSIGSIETQLGIPRSTLSGWFRGVTLTHHQKKLLQENWKKGLVKARKKASLWHSTQKQQRLDSAKKEACNIVRKINTRNKAVLELALAVLYLAEGSKKNVETALGSSDPRTLCFFISALRKLYNFDYTKIRCELYLRADQNPLEITKFWSEQLGLPAKQFKQVNFDKRSVGKKSYDSYKGVCSLRCGNVAIQRRLVYLAEEYFDIIAQQ